jgi:hypothetical protein
MNTYSEAARQQAGTDSLKKRYEATPDFVTSEFPDPEVLLWTCLSIVEDYMRAGRPLPEHVRKAPFATLPWLNGMLATPCLRGVLAKARLPLAVVIEMRRAFSSYKGGCEPAERLALKRANRLLIEHFYKGVPRHDAKRGNER